MLKSMALGTAATSWWMAGATFPSPPHVLSFQGFQGLHSLSAARSTKPFLHQEKYSLSIFTFFFKGDLGVLMEKKSNCVVRVSLRAGMLPVSSPQSVAASPALSHCSLPIWKQVLNFQV